MAKMKNKKTRKQNRIKLGIKIWISSDKAEGIFGDGKYRILKAIALHGSIKKAAEYIGMSYRKAWGDIKKAETTIGKQLLLKTRGSKIGGSSTLTPFAKELLRAYEKFRNSMTSHGEKNFNRHLKNFFAGRR